MKTINLKVNLTSTGTVTLTDNGKIVTSVTIEKDKDMSIEIGTGFTASAFVNSFTIFNEIGSSKGGLIGAWNRTAPTAQPSSEMSITSVGTTGILVTDTDTIEDSQFFFSVQVTDGGTVYDTDPELRVKKMRG